MKNLKDSIHRLSNHLQGALGYMELKQYDKALGSLHETMLESSILAREISTQSSLHLVGLDAVAEMRIEAKNAA